MKGVWMNGNLLRLTHHGREYEFGVGAIERKGDRVRVSLRYGDDTQGHFLITEEMGRVKSVSGGSGPEVRMRIEKEQRRFHIMAALRGGDDVSGHAMEESFTGEAEGEEVTGHTAEDAEDVELGLAAAAAWVTLARSDSETQAGAELPSIG